MCPEFDFERCTAQNSVSVGPFKYTPQSIFIQFQLDIFVSCNNHHRLWKWAHKCERISCQWININALTSIDKDLDGFFTWLQLPSSSFSVPLLNKIPWVISSHNVVLLFFYFIFALFFLFPLKYQLFCPWHQITKLMTQTTCTEKLFF